MLSPCVVRFALRNGSDIYFLQMVLGVFRFLLHIETSEFNGSFTQEFKRRVTYCCGPILRIVFSQSTLLRLLSASTLFHTELELQWVR